MNKTDDEYLTVNKYKDLDSLEVYINEMTKYPLLSAEEERKLTNNYFESKNSKIKNKLVSSNLRLVYKFANEYKRKFRNISLMDLIQEGNMGLVVAVEKFDPSKNVRFSTYASYWIKNSISLYVRQNFKPLKYSLKFNEELARYHKAKKELFESNGKEPSRKEISNYMKLPEDKISSYENFQQNIVSLNSIVGAEEDTELIELIQDKSYDDPCDKAIEEISNEKIHEIVNQLSDEEQIILNYSIGLYGIQLSYDEISEMLYQKKITSTKLSNEKIIHNQKSIIRKVKYLILNKENNKKICKK